VRTKRGVDRKGATVKRPARCQSLNGAIIPVLGRDPLGDLISGNGRSLRIIFLFVIPVRALQLSPVVVYGAYSEARTFLMQLTRLGYSSPNLESSTFTAQAAFISQLS